MKYFASKQTADNRKKLIIAAMIPAGILAGIGIKTAGSAYNRRVPPEGINEGRYVLINGVLQWISIYGEDIGNPVLLYLHGGPGAATSSVDYATLRTIADKYTVVSWDQRNCGKSRNKEQDDIRLTPELFMNDAFQLVRYVLDYLGKEKLTLFGLSWGSLLGANLVLEHPELFDSFIASGLHADWKDNEEDIRRRALEHSESEGRPDLHDLAMGFDPEAYDEKHYEVRDKLTGSMDSVNKHEKSIDLPLALLFSPFYSLSDTFRYISGSMYPEKIINEFLFSGGMASMSVKSRTDYQVPFYLIQGENDVISGYKPARTYFESITAPDKYMITTDGGHASIMTRPGELTRCIEIIEHHRESRIADNCGREEQ